MDFQNLASLLNNYYITLDRLDDRRVHGGACDRAPGDANMTEELPLGFIKNIVDS